MYVRPQNHRYPSGVRLPENYSGNVFRDEPNSKENLDDPIAPTHDEGTKDEAKATEAALLSNGGFRLNLGSLFGGNGKIGTEELLIIAIILLLAESENNDDLVLFLILLFFIK